MSSSTVPGGPPPGTQSNKSNPAAAAKELMTLAADEFIALGRAMHAQDARAAGMAKMKLEQIQLAGQAMAAQDQPPGQAVPQGQQTGVPTPVSAPIDPLTRQPLNG